MRAFPILLIAGLVVAAIPAAASPILLVDALSGDILASQEATRPWHPASLTKMMTAHLALTVVEAAKRGWIRRSS